MSFLGRPKLGPEKMVKHRILWVIGAIVSLSWCCISIGQHAPNSCDAHAGIPFFPDRTDKGLDAEDINVTVAIPACERAVTENPLAGYHWFLLGRVYQAAGQVNDARTAYNRALDLGIVAAHIGLLALSPDEFESDRSVSILEEVAAAGFFPAAQVLAEEDDRNGNTASAVNRLQPLVAKKYPPAEVLMALILANQGDASKSTEIEKLLQSAATSDYVEGIVALAEFYEGFRIFSGFDDLPKDPWTETTLLPTKDPATGAEYVFTTSSKGGRAACGKLAMRYGE